MAQLLEVNRKGITAAAIWRRRWRMNLALGDVVEHGFWSNSA
jgi:hypothetical protein